MMIVKRFRKTLDDLALTRDRAEIACVERVMAALGARPNRRNQRRSATEQRLAGRRLPHQATPRKK